MNRAAIQRAAVQNLTEAMSSSLPAKDVMQMVAEEICLLTGAASAALCLLTPNREMLDFVAASGENAEQIAGLRVRVADSLAENVILTGAPVVLDSSINVETGNLFDSFTTGSMDTLEHRSSTNAARFMTARPRSSATVPILRSGAIIGTLSALNKQPSSLYDLKNASFDNEDIELLNMLAEFASLAITVSDSARMVREQSRELAVLYDSARTVAGSLNVQEVLDSVLDAICARVEYHNAVLFLLNDEGTHLFIAAERGLSEEEREIQLSVDSGPAQQVLISGLPRLISNTEIEPDFENLSESSAALSAMMAPVRSRNETHGLIMINCLQRNGYNEEDLKLLSLVGLQAGIAIENAWQHEDTRRQAEQTSALYELSRRITSTLHVDLVPGYVADSVMNLLNVDKFALLLYDKEEDRLKPALLRGVQQEQFLIGSSHRGDGISGWVLEMQTPQAVANVAADARNRTSPIDQADIASTLCVPMHVGEEVIGVIHAMSSKRRLFTVAEMELLYTIANQAAVAMVNAMHYQEARSKSLEMRRYIRRIAHALGSAMQDKDMPKLLTDLAVEIMRSDRCALYRLEGDSLHLEAACRFRNSLPPDETVPLGQGLSGWVARRGQSLLLSTLIEDPRARWHHWLHRDNLTSYMGIPLKAGHRTVGVLEVFTTDPRVFTKEEAQLLSTFARRARVVEKLALQPA